MDDKASSPCLKKTWGAYTHADCRHLHIYPQSTVGSSIHNRDSWELTSVSTSRASFNWRDGLCSFFQDCFS